MLSAWGAGNPAILTPNFDVQSGVLFDVKLRLSTFADTVVSSANGSGASAKANADFSHTFSFALIGPVFISQSATTSNPQMPISWATRSRQFPGISITMVLLTLLTTSPGAKDRVRALLRSNTTSVAPSSAKPLAAARVQIRLPLFRTGDRLDADVYGGSPCLLRLRAV
jgi:hypothetical protein